MPLDVVHGNQGKASGVGKAFGIGEAHQKRPNQPWSCCDRYKIQFPKGYSGRFDGPADDRIDYFEMSSGGHFRDDPSKGGVQVVLILDHRRKHLAAVLDNGCGGIVAGCLNSQYKHRQ